MQKHILDDLDLLEEDFDDLTLMDLIGPSPQVLDEVEELFGLDLRQEELRFE